MFGFLKKLVKKSEPPPQPAPPPQPTPVPPPVQRPPAVAAPSAPTQPASKVVMPATSSQRPAATPITPHATTPAPTAQPAAPLPPVNLSGPVVEIPLKSLWPKLDPTIIQAAKGKPNAPLKLPLELIQPMLARGAVKIPYDHFRQFAPADLFPAIPGKERFDVNIPLAEILACLTPDQLPRRSQKKIEVPDDIGPVFGPAGATSGLRISDGKSKPMAPGAVPVAVPVETPIEPEAPAPDPVAKVAEPPAPVIPAAPVLPAPSPVVATEAPAPAPPPPVLNTEPIRAPKLDPSLASLKPKTTAPEPGTFNISVMDLAEHWTKSGRRELENLYRNTLEIPVSKLESALKTGKLVFPWRELRNWVRLTPGNTLPTIPDDYQVELPLAVVAPKFLALHGAGKFKKQVQVSDEIPDLFARKDASGSAPAAQIATPATATPAPAAPNAARPALDYGDIFGQPDKKTWSLPEVTQKTAALRGVAGALIGTSDGLLISGTWPPGVQMDSVAAFIPQMYSRMVQCTKELNLGEPGNFTLTIENMPLQIFKTNNNYFVVLGRAGENLPKAQLTALAARLAMTQPAK